MDLQRSLLKTYRFFVITVLQHIDARSVHFFSFLSFTLKIAQFTEVRFSCIKPVSLALLFNLCL